MVEYLEIEFVTTCEQCGKPIGHRWHLRLIRLCKYCYRCLFPKRSRNEVISDDTIIRLIGAGQCTPTRDDWTFEWNYEASDTLREAVADKVVTKIEAEIMMEYTVYERTFGYIAQELKFNLSVVVSHYETALGKLRKWLSF